MKTCQWHVFWIRKSGLRRRQGSLRLCSERSETKDRIPPGVPFLEFYEWGWKNNYSKISSIRIEN
ncbi:MAG: hypothetical protein GH148_02775 [Clostridia bacterium]|nr:hypothetical protein [Clostridia bacterium]